VNEYEFENMSSTTDDKYSATFLIHQWYQWPIFLFHPVENSFTIYTQSVQ